MLDIDYQPLDRSRKEIRLIILDDGVESVEYPNLESRPLRCQLITTSLGFYNTEFNPDWVKWVSRVLLLSQSPLLLVSELCGLLNYLRLAIPRTAQRKPMNYYALSYVWGDPECVCDIEIDGKGAKITKNLAGALRSIQANTDIRIIWADAICINQQDDDEKSRQVQQMATVYKRAAAIVSWLGPATAHTELAFAALGALRPRSNFGVTQRVKLWQPKHRIPLFLKDAISTYLSLPEHRILSLSFTQNSKREIKAVESNLSVLIEDPEFRRAILAIAGQPYWSRVWVFQELGLARERIFLCGNSTMEALDLALRAVMNWRGLNRTQSSSLFQDKLPSMVAVSHALGIRQRKIHFGSNPGEKRRRVLSVLRDDDFPFLLTLLRRLHTLHATDIRDHVYALVSIAGDRRELGIIPDYTKSPSAVFTEVTSALLKSGQLDVLLDATRAEPSADLPSWVPDWSNLSALGFNANNFRLNGSKKRQRSLNVDNILSSAGCIEVGGYIVDEITLVGETYRNKTFNGSKRENDDDLETWIKSLEEHIWDHARYINAPDAGPGLTKSKITLEIFLTATIGHPETDGQSSIPLLPTLSDFWSLIFDSRQDTLQELTTLNYTSYDEFIQERCVELIKKRLFSKNSAQPSKTIKGYSCLGAHDRCKKGDLIVIFPGVGIPLVVRRTTAQDYGAERPWGTRVSAD